VTKTLEYESPAPLANTPDPRAGLAMGLGAYLSWGFIALYFRLVRHVPPVGVVAYRVLWSVIFLAVLLSVLGGWDEVRRAVRSRTTMLGLCGSSILIAANWVVFVWAIEHAQVMQASLGYFINPLVSVLLGMTFLRERLRKAQWLACALAAVGVARLTASVGTLPWVALALALSFGFYGLLRKLIPVGALVGLTVETTLLAPLALAYILIETHPAQLTPATHGLLALAGPVTALPLLMFAGAARRLKLSTMGFLQYLAPTCQLLLAVFAFGEPFTRAQAISFSLIWAALAVFSVDSAMALRGRAPREKRVAATPSVALEG
jgi:chloramphenicol-sensitive protein RarD